MGGGVSIESKAVHALGSESLRCAVVGMQGKRGEMEDMHIARPRAAVTKVGGHSVGLFAVLDGHAGAECAKLAAGALPAYLLQQNDDDDDDDDDNDNDDGKKDTAPESPQLNADWLVDDTMTDAVLACDEELRGREYLNGASIGGSTLVFAFVEPIVSATTSSTAAPTPPSEFAVTVGNVGDSRAVFGRRVVADGNDDAAAGGRDNIYAGYSFDTIALSEDHKPINDAEKARILAAGGQVLFERVDGNLAVARALGDFEYKNALALDARSQKVVCVPEYQRTTAVRGDFLFLACDGIFDVMNNRQVVEMVGRLLGGDDAATSSPDAVVRAVVDHCLAEGSKDNMTALLVLFESGTEYHRAGWRFYPGVYGDGGGGGGGGSGGPSESFMTAYADNIKAHGLDVDTVLRRVKAGDYSPIDVPDGKL